MSRATLAKGPAEVAAMFDGVAARYDLTNDVLSGFQTRRWRRATRAALDLRAGDRVLDLAAGTATSSTTLTQVGAQVVAADFSLGMLRAGQQRLREQRLTGGLHLLGADGLSLPFADASFHRVTMSFGLRNTVDVEQCLRELLRVTKPRGRLVVCEFSHPGQALLDAIYSGYLLAALPRVAAVVSSNSEAYRYLAESIQAWPDQAGLAQVLQAAGWTDVAWRDLSFGVVALHRGTRAA